MQQAKGPEKLRQWRVLKYNEIFVRLIWRDKSHKADGVPSEAR